MEAQDETLTKDLPTRDQLASAGQQQGRINMQQAEGESDTKRRRVQQLLAAGGQDKALDVATSAEGGAEFLESAGASQSKIDMSAGDGQLQNDPPAKNNFRQKKKPTVHHTSRRTGDYRATHKGGRGKQLGLVQSRGERRVKREVCLPGAGVKENATPTRHCDLSVAALTSCWQQM